MAKLKVHMFPCLSDNYGYLVHDPDSGATACIDTPDAAAIEAALRETGWSLTHILNTHHHADHAGGNMALKAATGCVVVGPRADAQRIPGIDVEVGEGDTVALGAHEATVHDTPGHTRGHIVYHFRDQAIAFVGDTLFAMGCGRLFEGTPGQMWRSLSKIMEWPDDTVIYCAHEYTEANARFALSVDPDNQALLRRAREVKALRAGGHWTVPTTLALEKATNPFLRAADPGLRAHLGMGGASDVEVFAETRRRKDSF
jgi:hydroxyacylglutathione hydrolase